MLALYLYIFWRRRLAPPRQQHTTRAAWGCRLKDTTAGCGRAARTAPLRRGIRACGMLHAGSCQPGCAAASLGKQRLLGASSAQRRKYWSRRQNTNTKRHPRRPVHVHRSTTPSGHRGVVGAPTPTPEPPEAPTNGRTQGACAGCEWSRMRVHSTTELVSTQGFGGSCPTSCPPVPKLWSRLQIVVRVVCQKWSLVVCTTRFFVRNDAVNRPCQGHCSPPTPVRICAGAWRPQESPGDIKK